MAYAAMHACVLMASCLTFGASMVLLWKSWTLHTMDFYLVVLELYIQEYGIIDDRFQQSYIVCARNHTEAKELALKSIADSVADAEESDGLHVVSAQVVHAVDDYGRIKAMSGPLWRSTEWYPHAHYFSVKNFDEDHPYLNWRK